MFTKQSRRNPIKMFFWRNHCFLVRVRHKQAIKSHFINRWNFVEMVIQFKADADGLRSLWYLAMINTVRHPQGDLPPSPLTTRIQSLCIITRRRDTNFVQSHHKFPKPLECSLSFIKIGSKHCYNCLTRLSTTRSNAEQNRGHDCLTTACYLYQPAALHQYEALRINMQ